MMKNYKFGFLSILFISIFSSCYVTQPIVQIEPNSNEYVFWHEGEPIAEKKIDSIVALAAFSHVSGDFYVFDVEIFNDSEAPILVAPEDMYISIADNYKIPSIDPKKMILSIEKEREEVKKRQRNAAIATGVFVLATIVAVAITSKNRKSNRNRNNDYSRFDDDGWDLATDVVLPSIVWGLEFHDQAVLSTHINSIPLTSDLVFWRSAALYKTTLSAGESIRGLIAYPRNHFSDLLLVIPVENVQFEFMFNQKTY